MTNKQSKNADQETRIPRVWSDDDDPLNNRLCLAEDFWIHATPGGIDQLLQKDAEGEWSVRMDNVRARAPMTDASIQIEGQRMMRDARGRLVPIDLVRPQDLLQDEMVRKIAHYAGELSDQIARFKGHAYDDIGAFDALLEAEYGGHARKSVKGNRTYMTLDGCVKVSVQISERIAFGPELQVARDLVDECLGEWASGSRQEIRAVVQHAFQVDTEGEISRGAIYSLLHLDIDDKRWKAAMQAIQDAMRVVGSKSYIRVHKRANPEASWEPVTIDLAKA